MVRLGASRVVTILAGADRLFSRRVQARYLVLKKRSHDGRDLVDGFVQREVAGIQNMDLCTRHALLVDVRPGKSKGWVVPSPNYEKRRLVLSHPFLPFWIRRDIGLIIEEQVSLDLTLSGT